jgi:hypothetical protein
MKVHSRISLVKKDQCAPVAQIFSILNARAYANRDIFLTSTRTNLAEKKKKSTVSVITCENNGNVTYETQRCGGCSHEVVKSSATTALLLGVASARRAGGCT